MRKNINDIFNNLHDFIVDIGTNENQRNKYIVKSNPSEKLHAFSRNRSWNFETVVMAVMFSSKETLTSRLAEFFEATNMKPTSKEAFIKRRALVAPAFFQDVSQHLVTTAKEAGLLPMWNGGNFLANIDGTRISLPFTKELYAKYRQRHDKGHNMARVTFIADSLSHVILSAEMVPDRTEERKATLSLLTNQPFPYPLDKTVFTMDRGYPSLHLMNWFHKNTAGFIIKSRRDTNPQIATFMDSDETEKTITIEHSKNRRGKDYQKPDPLEVRLVKLPRVSQEKPPVVIITDLMDTEIYPNECIYEAYRKRWSVETTIGVEKNELQLELFSGNRECCILQDFYASLIMYNMGILIKIVADQKITERNSTKSLKHTYQTDLNIEWRMVRQLILVIDRPRSKIDGLLTLIVNFCTKNTSVIRPDRHEPHKKRFIKTSGKYITFQNYRRPF